MTENDDYEIADLISKISPYIRFIGVISKTGDFFHIIESWPIIRSKKDTISIAQIAIKTELEEQFDEQLGDTEFVWEERTKCKQLHLQYHQKESGLQLTKTLFVQKCLELLIHVYRL